MGIVRIRLNFLNQGEIMHNVLHYKFDDNETRDYQVAADYIRDAWANGLALRIADDCELQSITYNELSFQSVDTDVVFTAGSASGAGGAQNSTITQIAMVLSTVCEQPFKPNRGRIFLTGWATDQISDGLFTTQATDAADAWGTAMQTVPNGSPSGLALVVYSKTNVALGEGLVSNDVVSFQAKRIASTLRRRKRNVGI